MYDVVIIHGSYGSPFENWFPWLHQSLNERGKKVLVPQFPTPDGQSYSKWAAVLDVYKDLLSPNSIFIAHSLGPAFVADYLIERRLHIGLAVLVVPFYGILGLPEFDEVNKSFFEPQVQLSEMRKLVSKCVCLFADDDPYVPAAMSQDFAEKAGAEIEIVTGGKHLNAAAGYNRFNRLLEVVSNYDRA